MVKPLKFLSTSQSSPTSSPPSISKASLHEHMLTYHQDAPVLNLQDEIIS
jgi:hypothetical protein